MQKLNNPMWVKGPGRVAQPNGLGFSFKHITRAKLNGLIASISIYKLSGIENISSRALKDAFSILDEQLLHIMNQFIISGIFPEAWKLATVIPLQENES